MDKDMGSEPPVTSTTDQTIPSGWLSCQFFTAKHSTYQDRWWDSYRHPHLHLHPLFPTSASLILSPLSISSSFPSVYFGSRWGSGDFLGVRRRRRPLVWKDPTAFDSCSLPASSYLPANRHCAIPAISLLTKGCLFQFQTISQASNLWWMDGWMCTSVHGP